MPDNLTQRVISVIAKTQRIPPEKISPESTFEELGLDSLDAVNILFALEEEFNLDFPDEASRGIRTIRDVVGGIEKLQAGSAGVK